jgi:hypothetical protein
MECPRGIEGSNPSLGTTQTKGEEMDRDLITWVEKCTKIENCFCGACIHRLECPGGCVYCSNDNEYEESENCESFDLEFESEIKEAKKLDHY